MTAPGFSCVPYIFLRSGRLSGWRHLPDYFRSELHTPVGPLRSRTIPGSGFFLRGTWHVPCRRDPAPSWAVPDDRTPVLPQRSPPFFMAGYSGTVPVP